MYPMMKSIVTTARVSAALVAIAIAAAACGVVTAPSPSILVTILPTATNVAAGKSQTFTAGDPRGNGVTWSLSGASCSGLSCGALMNTTATSTDYVAPTDVAVPRQAILRATSRGDLSQTATATVTVYTPGTIGVHVSPATFEMTNSQIKQFVATVDNDPTDALVTWKLAGRCNPFAPCGSLSPIGTKSGAPMTFLPLSSMWVGTAKVTITATSDLDPASTASAIVTLRCVRACVP
jgi:hypothetical protein